MDEKTLFSVLVGGAIPLLGTVLSWFLTDCKERRERKEDRRDEQLQREDEFQSANLMELQAALYDVMAARGRFMRLDNKDLSPATSRKFTHSAENANCTFPGSARRCAA